MTALVRRSGSGLPTLDPDRPLIPWHAAVRHPVLVCRPGRAPVPGRLLWVAPSGKSTRVTLSAGGYLTVSSDHLQLVDEQ